MLVMKLWVSAFLSKSALIGAIKLKTNLNITDSSTNMIMVGKTRNNPLSKVLIKNDLVHFLSWEAIFVFGNDALVFISSGVNVIDNQ